MLAVVLIAGCWLLLEESYVGHDSEPPWVGRCRATLIFCSCGSSRSARPS
jgi:hypothetical protein